MPKLEQSNLEQPPSSSQPLIKTGNTYFRVNGRLKRFKSNFYERSLLEIDSKITGPAVILQHDSTTVLPPSSIARIEASGNMIIDTYKETA